MGAQALVADAHGAGAAADGHPDHLRPVLGDRALHLHALLTMANRHAGPPPSADAVPVPEPSFAERARTLIHLGQTGTLATLSRRHPGHPFASVMPYVLDGDGRPLFL